MLMNSKWHCDIVVNDLEQAGSSPYWFAKNLVEQLCLKTSLLNIIEFISRMNWHSGFVSYMYRSFESQQSLKCWNLKTFRMKKCLEDTNIKSTIQTFDLVCFPEGEQLFWTIILSNFEMSEHDVLIRYLANPIKMTS